MASAIKNKITMAKVIMIARPRMEEPLPATGCLLTGGLATDAGHARKDLHPYDDCQEEKDGDEYRRANCFEH
jgi:hypothetical protein